jgi:hypothetical protein
MWFENANVTYMLRMGQTASRGPTDYSDNISFQWPLLYPLLFLVEFLSHITERILYRNVGDLPAPRAVRPAKAPAARRQFVKGLSLNFTDNRVPFALELPITKVLRLLSRLRTLNVEVSVHEN